MDRLGGGLAHQGGRAEHAVEPGHRDHLDDGGDAPALGSEPSRPGAVELDLGRGVGAVAELVLEALDAEDVAGAVVEHPGDDEAGQPALGLGEHEEHVAHRRRAEPLVPGQGVLAVGRERLGPRGVGADVRAALLLGHAHAGQAARLRGGLAQASVVRRGPQPGLPLCCDGRVGAQCRDRCVGHRDRAAVAGLDLRPDQEAGRAHAGGRPCRRRGPTVPRAVPRRRRPRAARARRGGSRPRRPGCRSGHGSAGPGDGCWPRVPSAVPAPTRPAPRARPGP